MLTLWTNLPEMGLFLIVYLITAVPFVFHYSKSATLITASLDVPMQNATHVARMASRAVGFKLCSRNVFINILRWMKRVVVKIHFLQAHVDSFICSIFLRNLIEIIHHGTRHLVFAQ